MSVKEIFKWILLSCITFGTVAMYQPDIYLSDQYVQIKNVLIVALGVLLMLSFSIKKYKRSQFLRKFIFAIVAVSLEFLLFFLFSMNVYWDDLIQLVLVLLFIFVGMGMRYNRKALILLCTLYCISTLLLAIISLNTYLGGFNMAANQFLIEGKNQLGALVAIGGGTAFYLSQHIDGKPKWFYYSLALLIFLLLLVIRCRTALIAYFVFVSFFILRFWSGRSKAFFFLFFILISIIYSETIIGLLNTVILENGDAEDLNSVSTGRFERNSLGIDYFLSHFFDGELLCKSGIELIHNYILLRLVRYGIWGILFIYVYVLFLVEIIRSFSKKRSDVKLVGAYLLTIPFFCSLLEPSAPFGPGTVQMIPFLLYGIAINVDNHVVSNN